MTVLSGNESLMEQLALQRLHDPDAVERWLEAVELDDLDDPELWLRPDQLAAMRSLAAIILMLAGRGAGKTRTGASWTNDKAEQNPGCIIHLVGRTVGDVRDVMVRGESGIIQVARKSFMPEYIPSLRKVIWPNTSYALTFSSEKPGQLRGPQSHYTWADELAAWNHRPDDSGTTAWDNVKLSTRLGARPQTFVTTTPKRHKVIRELKNTVTKRGDPIHAGSTFSNRANLSADYLAELVDMYAGTALEQQELYGVLLDLVEGAMWRPEDITLGGMEWLLDRDHATEVRELVESAGLDADAAAELLVKLGADDGKPPDIWSLVSVDPGVTTGGDATGIMTMRGTKESALTARKVLVTGDWTEEDRSPDQWAAAVVEAWTSERDETGTVPVVVAEKNQGGEMVATVIAEAAGELKIPVALVTAKNSKAARAEPIAMAYRKGRIRHADEYDAVVDELTGWEPPVPGGSRGSGWSPNRLDALVHGCRALIVDDKQLRRFTPVRAEEPGEVIPVPHGRWKQGGRSMKPSWK